MKARWVSPGPYFCRPIARDPTAPGVGLFRHPWAPAGQVPLLEYAEIAGYLCGRPDDSDTLRLIRVRSAAA